MKKRCSERAIIGFLRDPERRVAMKDLCQRHGFSEASHELWRSRFGGMAVSDARRLKKLLAESMLENEVSREARRKVVTAPTGRELVQWMQSERGAYGNQGLFWFRASHSDAMTAASCSEAKDPGAGRLP